MGEVRRKRPWLAVLLALVISGLGHAYLRRWGRALGWYLAITLTLVFIVPDATVDQLIAGTRPPIADVVPALIVVVFSVVDVYVLAVRNNREYERRRAAERERAAEAASGGRGPDSASEASDSGEVLSDASGSTADGSAGGGSAADGSTAAVREGAVPALDCPNCGREVDAELDFCHWCTEELPWADGNDG